MPKSKAAHTPGSIVAEVMKKLEDRGANLDDYGQITADEIGHEIPIIAAAPELLEACKLMLEAVRPSYDNRDVAKEAAAIITMRAAISKCEVK